MQPVKGMLHRLSVSLIILIFLIPGCIETQSVIGDEREEIPLRLTFKAETLDRAEDQGPTFDLKEELKDGPVLMLWVGSSCFGCHDWTNMIRESLENGTLNESTLSIVSVHRWSNLEGAEEVMRHHQTVNESLSPIAAAYRGIFDTIIKETDRVGFLNNKPAFTTFKDHLKEAVGGSTLTAAQHKMIDRALFLKIMTRPHSPFVDNGIISEDNFNNMYINPDNNLVKRLQEMKELYPELNTNLFVSLAGN